MKPPAFTFFRASSPSSRSTSRTCRSWWTVPTARAWSRRWWTIRPISASLSFPVKEKRLQVVKIHSDEIKVVVPADHPLAAKKQVLSRI